MIEFHVMEEGRIRKADEAVSQCWIEARSVTPSELVELENRYGILQEHLLDIMDLDEQARIEKEDEYTLVLIKLPLYSGDTELRYSTVPIGILLFPDKVITVCQSDCDVLSELRSGRVRGLDVKNKSAFVLHSLGRAAIVFLRYLKDLNRRTSQIERELQKSVKNNELIQLLTIEKSLVYFRTALKSNEILLEKLQNSRLMRFKEDETELLEDVMTDNRQAIEMANIHSDILSGMMDAFASVISNNLNIVMKRLTVISIVLMVPTLVVSVFGMNVPIPGADGVGAFPAILGISAAFALVSALLLNGRSPRLPKPKQKRDTSRKLT
jgi:magnesium transporter